MEDVAQDGTGGFKAAHDDSTQADSELTSTDARPHKKQRKDSDAPSNHRSRKDRGSGNSWKAERMGRRRGTRLDKPSVPDGAAGAEADMSATEKAPRLPKRNCALLIGFCGSGYNGMQIQPNVRTIEGELFKALVKAGAVSKDNADDPVKVNLGRAARTDAGVHAAGNVVSLKMICSVPGIPDIVARINDELAPEIRVWSYARVQGSFSARISCDSRKYTYFFPSYLMIPPKPGSGLHRTFHKFSQPPGPDGTYNDDPSPVETPYHEFWDNSPTPVATSTRQEDMARKKRWRVGKEEVERLRATSARYEATHNFHNFTLGRDPKDRSCQRHMKSIQIAEPAVYGETEWISVLFHGQSFMLHQRKMMTVLVISSRTATPPRVIDELYTARLVNVPKMPSLGLLLEQPIFESYNAKIAPANKDLTAEDADFRPAIDFEQHAEEIERFKQEQIYARMRAAEKRLEVFDRWVRTLDAYNGDDLAYFNARGVIPDVAVLRRGERRSKPFREKRRFDVTDFPEDDEKAKETVKQIEPEEVEGMEEGDVDTEEAGLSKAELVEAEG